jgi:hypothetical protein
MIAIWHIFWEIGAKVKNFKNVKLMYSEKATKFCKISTLLLSYVVPVKSKVEILHTFVAFSEYMNFKPPLSTERSPVPKVRSC